MPIAAISPSHTPIFRVWSMPVPDRSAPKSGGLMMLMMIRTTDRTPRPATTALAATGRPTSASEALSAARPTAATTVMNRTMSMKPYEPQAFRDPSNAKPPTPAFRPNHLKMNMIRISAIPEPPAIFSPCVSLLRSIDAPSGGRVQLGSARDGRSSPTTKADCAAQPIRRVSRIARQTGRSAPAGFGGQDRVLKQHRDRHRAHPAGHRSDRAGHLQGGLEIDVADQAVLGAIHADVDHRCARLDPVRLHETRRADGGHQDVGAMADAGQIPGPGVADGDRGIRVQQQTGEGAADQDRAPHDHRVRALGIDPGMTEQLHHAARSAWDEARAALGQQASASGGQSVDVLRRV